MCVREIGREREREGEREDSRSITSGVRCVRSILMINGPSEEHMQVSGVQREHGR